MHNGTILVAIFCGIILRANNQTTALTSTPIHRFNDINHFLFVFQWPIDFIVVTRSQINHNVLVPEKEHNGARIVQLVPETDNTITKVRKNQSGSPRERKRANARLYWLTFC